MQIHDVRPNGVLTPFLAEAGFRTPIVVFLGSCVRWASVGDMLRAASTLGPSPGSKSSPTKKEQQHRYINSFLVLSETYALTFVVNLTFCGSSTVCGLWHNHGVWGRVGEGHFWVVFVMSEEVWFGCGCWTFRAAVGWQPSLCIDVQLKQNARPRHINTNTYYVFQTN